MPPPVNHSRNEIIKNVRRVIFGHLRVLFVIPYRDHRNLYMCTKVWSYTCGREFLSPLRENVWKRFLMTHLMLEDEDCTSTYHQPTINLSKGWKRGLSECEIVLIFGQNMKPRSKHRGHPSKDEPHTTGLNFGDRSAITLNVCHWSV